MSTHSTSANFNGKPGHRYSFYSLAHDNVGHSEAGKTVAEASTAIAIHSSNQEWHNEFFTIEELENPSLESTLWGDRADPDFDGIANLLEYYLGLNPRQSDSDQILSIEITANECIVSYARTKNIDDVDGRIRRSSNLSNWEDPLNARYDPPIELGDGREMIRVHFPLTEGTKAFFRLHLIRLTGEN